MWLFVLVGALWGCTNPLLNSGSKNNASQPAVDSTGTAAATNDRSGSGTGGGGGGGSNCLSRLLRDVTALLSNWRFVIPFAINQFGSVAYVAALAASDLSIAVPACNALTTLFTAVTARALNEQTLPPRAVAGISLILGGITVCVWSEQLTAYITGR